MLMGCEFSAAFLEQLRQKEKELSLEPDYAVDSYLKATSVEGKRQNAVTHFIMRVLGLEVTLLSISLPKDACSKCCIWIVPDGGTALLPNL